MENPRKKLLYVCPHLSTGGQPQYTYKQIKHFINEFDIEVVEINNSGGDAFVVQKNRIKSLVAVHTLGEDKTEIIEIIEQYNPDIIHFQEIPQFIPVLKLCYGNIQLKNTNLIKKLHKLN